MCNNRLEFLLAPPGIPALQSSLMETEERASRLGMGKPFHAMCVKKLACSESCPEGAVLKPELPSWECRRISLVQLGKGLDLFSCHYPLFSASVWCCCLPVSKSGVWGPEVKIGNGVCLNLVLEQTAGMCCVGTWSHAPMPVPGTELSDAAFLHLPSYCWEGIRKGLQEVSVLSLGE